MIVISLLMRSTVVGIGMALWPTMLAPARQWGATGFRPTWSEAPSNAWALFDACFGPRMRWSQTWTFTTNPPTFAPCIEVQWPSQLLILTTSPITFALAFAAFIVWVLPETSRRAKLRHVHVWRAAAYAPVAIGLSVLANSFFVCVLMADEIVAKTTNSGSIVRQNYALIAIVRESLTILLNAWVFVFWSSAILRGWRLKHGAATCVLLTIGAAAAAALVSTLLFFLLYRTEADHCWIIQL